MKFSKEKLIEILPKAITNTSNKELTINCPWCNKRECGIAIYKDNHPFQCFRKKNCGVTSNIYGILKQLDKEHLIEGTSVNPFNQLENKLIKNEDESGELFSDKEINFPVGFQRIYNDEYLNSRWFIEKDYQLYPVGETKVWPKYKNYILFLVYERELLRGFVGRYKNESVPDYKPKYINSEEFDSEGLVYNYDAITENTNTVILVEGIMDCINVNRLLNYDEEVVSCGTFGAKISNSQIAKLRYKGVENLILLFDPDVISKIKQYSYKLLQKFNTYVGDLQNVDPGELSYNQFCYVLDKLYNPFEYFISKVDKKIV